MIFGRVHVTHSSVDTHRDSYLLDQLTVVSVRRPFLGAGITASSGLAIFTVGFVDLLYLKEIVALSGLAVIALSTALQLAQLQLLSRDLRGSELSGAIFGTYRHLNHLRLQIAQAMHARVIRGQ